MRWTSRGPLVALLALLAGCAAQRNPAPVVERMAPGQPMSATPSTATTSGQMAAQETSSSSPAAGAENAGKPGYHTVKPGETMIRIGLDNGQNWRDIARWNAIANPNLIEVGQVLRVWPPGADPSAAASRPVMLARSEVRPLDARVPPAPATAPAGPTGSPAPMPLPTPAPTPVPTPVPVPVPVPLSPAAAPVVREGDDDINWLWPASGQVASGFEEGRSKGLAIIGKAGDPVLAAADGRVVYAGSGLRGYGNLVIVKHNNTYLTAYAHNQSLLVKEDQAVRRGQKIAEMGSTDAERVQLHFEVRRQGKPIDPTKLLPAR